jgi:aspartate kinase
MAVVVQKYGGSSVADAERLKSVAARVARVRAQGDDVVVVVSALGDTTDDLLALAAELNPSPPDREMDMLLSTGEQVSIALLAMALDAAGVPAISFTGQQVGIVTDNSFTKAKIREVRADRIREQLAKGRVVVVAGFQGVSVDGEDITTLGRGGSDTTAVAIAAELKADVCEIYTDVEGVFTADPRIVPGARKISEISYDEMLEAAANGAKVLQLRSVEYGRNHGVVIHVRSSFCEDCGTLVKGEDAMMERAILSQVTYDASEAKVTIRDVPDRPGVAARVFRVLADANVNVDMIVQNISEAGLTDISFTVNRDDLARAEEAVRSAIGDLGARDVAVDTSIAKVSLVGAGMKSHPGVAARMFEALAKAGINIEMISTSAIRISCVVPGDQVAGAVSAVHDEFEAELEQPEAVREAGA